MASRYDIAVGKKEEKLISISLMTATNKEMRSILTEVLMTLDIESNRQAFGINIGDSSVAVGPVPEDLYKPMRRRTRNKMTHSHEDSADAIRT